MSHAQRLQRLEQAEQERSTLIQVERVAAKLGVERDVLLRRAQEIGERIERWGLDAEVRRIALDHGLTEQEARARIEAARGKYGL